MNAKLMRVLTVATIVLSGGILQGAVWTDDFATATAVVTPTAAGTMVGNWVIWEQTYSATGVPYSYQVHNGSMDAWTIHTANNGAHISKLGFTEGITSFTYDMAYKAVGAPGGAVYCAPTLLFSDANYYLRGYTMGATSTGAYTFSLVYKVPGGVEKSVSVVTTLAQTDAFVSYEFKKTVDTTWSWYYTPSGGTQTLLGSVTDAAFASSAMQGVQFMSKSPTNANLLKHTLFDNVAVTTPEPTALLLLLAGAGVLGFRRRR